jgi:hypothetical protein
MKMAYTRRNARICCGRRYGVGGWVCRALRGASPCAVEALGLRSIPVAVTPLSMLAPKVLQCCAKASVSPDGYEVLVDGARDGRAAQAAQVAQIRQGEVILG